MASAPLVEPVGSVASVWRYPVKSMLGEEVTAADVNARGLSGDRAYALVDGSDGKVASAKNPRKWPQLFRFRAALMDLPQSGSRRPPVRITMPDGRVMMSDEPELPETLSDLLGRTVTVQSSTGFPRTARAEEYWPDVEGLDLRDTVTDFELPEGTFFDAAVLHLLTTATLDRLGALYPEGRFDSRRFRPNVVVATSEHVRGFAENAWTGRVVHIGADIRLRVTGPCGRCVMTTLAQGDLPKDSGILRTAARHNELHVGVYAAVLRGGRIRRGDAVSLSD